MIHDIDILQAIQQKLKERFPYPVYLQEVKEGFRPPAFFLKTMTVASPQGRKEVYRDTDMYITIYRRSRRPAHPSMKCWLLQKTCSVTGLPSRTGFLLSDR